jgi:hypothetical protein
MSALVAKLQHHTSPAIVLDAPPRTVTDASRTVGYAWVKPASELWMLDVVETSLQHNKWCRMH